MNEKAHSTRDDQFLSYCKEWGLTPTQLRQNLWNAGAGSQREEIERLQALQQWQPIQTAPKGIEILISGFNENNQSLGRWVSQAIDNGDGFHPPNAEDTYDGFYPPTHWMPLPAAPFNPSGNNA